MNENVYYLVFSLGKTNIEISNEINVNNNCLSYLIALRSILAIQAFPDYKVNTEMGEISIASNAKAKGGVYLLFQQDDSDLLCIVSS